MKPNTGVDLCCAWARHNGCSAEHWLSTPEIVGVLADATPYGLIGTRHCRRRRYDFRGAGARRGTARGRGGDFPAAIYDPEASRR